MTASRTQRLKQFGMKNESRTTITNDRRTLQQSTAVYVRKIEQSIKNGRQQRE